MVDPRLRILVTTVAALAVAVGASLSVVGSQQASGRSALTVRARAFLRALKGETAEGDRGRPVELAEFLRPRDRTSVGGALALRRLQDAFGDTNDEFLVAQVRLLGNGKARTYSPVVLSLPMGRGRAEEGLRELAWIQDSDGRWYLDPEGL